jgi:hypothetical protein
VLVLAVGFSLMRGGGLAQGSSRREREGRPPGRPSYHLRLLYNKPILVRLKRESKRSIVDAYVGNG